VVYATAWDEKQRFANPIEARFSPDLLTWSDPAAVFDPVRENAYGVYMHHPQPQGVLPPDRINPDLPPMQPPPMNNPGWAYGAFIVGRYTTWDPESRILDLSYVLSLGSPYQVQLMQTQLRLPDPVV
jgi:hypothetical protein